MITVAAPCQSTDDTVVSVDTVASTTASDTVATATAPDTFVLRNLPDTLVRRWKNDPELAYANDPAYWRIHPREKPRGTTLLDSLARLFATLAFRYTFYAFLALLVFFGIYRIMEDNNVRLFGRSKKKGKGTDTDEEVEQPEDLQQRLAHAINTGDYRQATRYLYLLSLVRLDARGLIRLHRDATNQDYLRQLSGSAWEASFRHLTNLYDKVWYGEFPLQETQFSTLHRYFEDFYKTVPA